MDSTEKLFNLLFEISNKDRYLIVKNLLKKESNLTQLTNIQGLRLSETRRHLSRLIEVGLIQKNLDGTYRITNYGTQILALIDNINFFTENQEYFESHSIEFIPKQFLSNFFLLSSSHRIDDMLDFMRILNQIISQAQTNVNIILEQIPWISTPSIIQGINRGVKFRIIEKKKPHLAAIEASILENDRELPKRITLSPFVEHATMEQIGSLVISTDNSASLILPSIEGKYDYNGFVTLQEEAIKWCNNLFEYFWEDAEKTNPEQVFQTVKQNEETHITVEGTENPSVDAYSVQDAVDNYDEVTLKGRFNFGTNSVLIKQSVKIIGTGKDDIGYPYTKIYKRGWNFPFYEPDSIFRIDGENADILIENIHFMDFNCSAIWGDYGNSLIIRNCDFTVPTGHHRGLSTRSYGDILYGIYIQFPYEKYLEGKRGSFPRGIQIIGNWIHFGWGGRGQSGYISSGVYEKDPEYRPDLLNHEYYIGMGIVIDMAAAEVVIEGNWIWYANARGVSVYDCFPSASVTIKENIIRSENYGSYPFNDYLSGIGILAQNGFNFASDRGFQVDIDNNIVEFTKMNYCGIGVLGPNVFDDELIDDGKLPRGSIRKNWVSLRNGHVGILIQGSDNFEITDNEVYGSSYYGIQVSGKERLEGYDRKSKANILSKNNFIDLKLRVPDAYSNNHQDGVMFSSDSKNSMAHIWFNVYSQGNELLAHADDIILNEGIDNKIIRELFTLRKSKQLVHPEKYR